MHLKIILEVSKWESLQLGKHMERGMPKLWQKLQLLSESPQKKKCFHQITDLDWIYPVKTEESLSKADVKISQACEELNTYKMETKILWGKFKRTAGYCQSWFLPHGRKAHDNGLRALLAERNLDNLRREKCMHRDVWEKILCSQHSKWDIWQRPKRIARESSGWPDPWERRVVMAWRSRTQCPICTRCYSHGVRIPEKASLCQAYFILTWILYWCSSHWQTLGIFSWFNFPPNLGACDPGRSSLILLSRVRCRRGDREVVPHSSLIVGSEAKAPQESFLPSCGGIPDPAHPPLATRGVCTPRLDSVSVHIAWKQSVSPAKLIPPSMSQLLKIQDQSKLLCLSLKVN